MPNGKFGFCGKLIQYDSSRVSGCICVEVRLILGLRQKTAMDQKPSFH